jgi:hypothetical protein
MATVDSTRKGAAAGVYNTTQSIGLAMGGMIGRLAAESGWTKRRFLHLFGAISSRLNDTDDVRVTQVLSIPNHAAEREFRAVPGTQ